MRPYQVHRRILDPLKGSSCQFLVCFCPYDMRPVYVHMTPWSGQLYKHSLNYPPSILFRYLERLVRSLVYLPESGNLISPNIYPHKTISVEISKYLGCRTLRFDSPSSSAVSIKHNPPSSPVVSKTTSAHTGLLFDSLIRSPVCTFCHLNDKNPFFLCR